MFDTLITCSAFLYGNGNNAERSNIIHETLQACCQPGLLAAGCKINVRKRADGRAGTSRSASVQQTSSFVNYTVTAWTVATVARSSFVYMTDPDNQLMHHHRYLTTTVRTTSCRYASSTRRTRIASINIIPTKPVWKSETPSDIRRVSDESATYIYIYIYIYIYCTVCIAIIRSSGLIPRVNSPVSFSTSTSRGTAFS